MHPRREEATLANPVPEACKSPRDRTHASGARAGPGRHRDRGHLGRPAGCCASDPPPCCGGRQRWRRHSRWACSTPCSPCEEEARELYDSFAVPAPGEPLFQAAAANLNPWTEAAVDTTAADSGPLLIISGERDHTVPWAIANASYKKQAHDEHAVTEITEITEINGRGHSLTIDHGWRQVADTALAFVRRFAEPGA
ncbi:hypothetical protein [Streptomyces sp. NPDC058874]|uniref:hypothetical protein n=1 Tax=unclassified Streptomyces TaxID=2593676 RepID=UPI00369925A4